MSDDRRNGSTTSVSINVIRGSTDDFVASRLITAHCSPENVIFGAGVAGRSFGAFEQEGPWQGSGLGIASEPPFSWGLWWDDATPRWWPPFPIMT